MTDALISLGGNQGDVRATLREALCRMHRPPESLVRAVSSFVVTLPVGTDAGGEFVNAAAVVETTLLPRELLARLMALETELGRVRTTRWGPRTLDLDLLLFGSEILDDGPVLRVPHPACWYRRFVLDPLAEIAPDFVHPEKQLTIRELRERLLIRPLPVAVISEADNIDLVTELQAAWPNVSLTSIRRPDEVPAEDAGLLVRLSDADLPSWVEPLRQRIGWLDASSIPGSRRQCLIDILMAACPDVAHAARVRL